LHDLPDLDSVEMDDARRGPGVAAGHLFALTKSQAAREWLRKFPRNYEIGVLLTIVATIWFLHDGEVDGPR
jgi:hypothetical protein